MNKTAGMKDTMIRQDAFTAMQNGAKITRADFPADRYYELEDGNIMSSERDNRTDVFWDFCGFKDGWVIYEPVAIANKTALERAIEEIEVKQAHYRDFEDRGRWFSYQETIDILTSLFPVEREQIEQAWRDGSNTGRTLPNQDKDYFNETYKGE